MTAARPEAKRIDELRLEALETRAIGLALGSQDVSLKETASIEP